eukprot:m.103469 g.103469  ORF g.103469 m.103469 type:complete len:154 (+) comp51574_c0_seq5:2667-3128(+)
MSSVCSRPAIEATATKRLTWLCQTRTNAIVSPVMFPSTTLSPVARLLFIASSRSLDAVAIAGTAVGLALCGIALVFLSLRQRTAIIASGSLALIFGVASVAAVGAILSESDVSPLARELTYGTYLAILACITNFAAVLVGSFVGHSVYDLMSV